MPEITEKGNIVSEEELREKVFQALGAASACWENLEGAGVFDAEKAHRIGEELVLDIHRYAEATP